LLEEPLSLVLVQLAENFLGSFIDQLFDHPSDGVSEMESEALEIALGGD
jgi:hypothetical protein